MGKFLLVLGGADLLQSAAIAPDWWVGCAGQQDGSFPTVAPKDPRCRERPVCRSAQPVYQTCATAARCKKSIPPQATKTSPESTRTVQSETNLCHVQAGALGGSSREVREVWRVGPPLRKRGSCASKVFSLPPQMSYFARISLGDLRRRVRAGSTPQSRQTPTIRISRAPASQNG